VYWIVKLESDNAGIYTKPAEGLYQDKKVYKPGQDIKVPTLEEAVPISAFVG
jgi:hypothetical protein